MADCYILVVWDKLLIIFDLVHYPTGISKRINLWIAQIQLNNNIDGVWMTILRYDVTCVCTSRSSVARVVGVFTEIGH